MHISAANGMSFIDFVDQTNFGSQVGLCGPNFGKYGPPGRPKIFSHTKVNIQTVHCTWTTYMYLPKWQLRPVNYVDIYTYVNDLPRSFMLKLMVSSELCI